MSLNQRTKETIIRLASTRDVSRALKDAKTRASAIRILSAAASEQGIKLSSEALTEFVKDDKVPRLSTLSYEQLMDIAGRSLQGRPTSWGHTCSCWHCVKTCL